MIGIYNDIKIYDANGGAETTYTGEAQVGVSATQYASVKNLKAGFEASQALNGYDFPWAEGSSVNKLPNAENFKGWVIGDSGAVAHVYKNYTGTVNFKSVLANIEPQQAGSGDPSPTNIRPITGFSSANIYVSPTTSVGDATTYNVSFGSAGTVYGGTLDAVSGQLTVTHGIKLVNELSWTYADTPSRCSAHITDIKRASGARRTTLLSSEYVCVDDGRALADVPNGSIYNTGTSDWVTIVDARYTTADAFTTAQGSQQIVYPLATPLTYQLTATQVAMITGNNYVWSDTGDMEDVSFYAQSGASYYAYLSAGNYLLSPKFRTRWIDGYTSKALSGQYSNTEATDVDLYICGTDAGLDSESWNLTKYVKWGTISLPYKSSMTSMPTQVIQTKTSNMTEGSGTITNVYFKFVNTSEGQVRLYRLQFEWNSSASAFRPYTNKGAITGISTLYLYKRSTPSGSQQTYYSKYLSGTRYKGVYDFRTGTLTLTHALVTLNSTNQTWYSTYTTSGSTNYYRYYCEISDMKVTGATSADFKCTDFRYTSSPNSYTTDWGFYGPYYSGSARLYIGNYPNYFATLDDFKAWLDAQETAGTPVRVMYPLTSPETVSLTGTTVTLNNGMTYFDGGTSNRFVSVEAVITDPYVMLKRPSDFVIEREDIYAGEYTTCLGATKADRIGWKYKDTNIVFSELTVDELAHLTSINGEFSIIFDDSDGEHTESVIRTGFANTPTRFTLPDGSVIWKDVGLAIRFINAHS